MNVTFRLHYTCTSFIEIIFNKKKVYKKYYTNFHNNIIIIPMFTTCISNPVYSPPVSNKYLSPLLQPHYLHLKVKISNKMK